jgi:hypothetical protein
MDHETLVSSENPAYDVLLVNRLCDGIASSDDVSIVLVDRRGERVPVLEYGAAYSFVRDSTDATPIIKWTGDKVLTISIGKIAYMTTRRDKVDGLRIETTIDEIAMQ